MTQNFTHCYQMSASIYHIIRDMKVHPTICIQMLENGDKMKRQKVYILHTMYAHIRKFASQINRHNTCSEVCVFIQFTKRERVKMFNAKIEVLLLKMFGKNTMLCV